MCTFVMLVSSYFIQNFEGCHSENRSPLPIRELQAAERCSQGQGRRSKRPFFARIPQPNHRWQLCMVGSSITLDDAL